VVRVKLFAVVRDRAGVSEMTLQLRASSTIANARDEIAKQLPQVEELLRKSAFALNREYAPVESELSDGDELAVIPPVSGG
jgi:molybdopterin converting factor subunit 1